MASTDEKQHLVAQDSEADRVEKAFERLQTAWRAVRARITPSGTVQADEAIMKELDSAEQEWLAARGNVSVRG
jgi:hypothetical protein